MAVRDPLYRTRFYSIIFHTINLIPQPQPSLVSLSSIEADLISINSWQLQLWHHVAQVTYITMLLRWLGSLISETVLVPQASLDSHCPSLAHPFHPHGNVSSFLPASGYRCTNLQADTVLATLARHPFFPHSLPMCPLQKALSGCCIREQHA